MKTPTIASIVLSCLVLGCGTSPKASEDPGASGRAPELGEIALAPSGTTTTFDGLLAYVRNDRAVYLGESHNNTHHHQLQLRIVEAMYEQDPRLVIGMEMFQRPSQPALDRVPAGETTEREFLRESEYFKRWRWDWRFYREIVLFAREKGLPVVALNSPAELNRKVSRGGGLQALAEEDRQWVAEEIDLEIEAHREFVMKVFESHPIGPGFDREAFYASQCVWEDTMAESTARALDSHPGYRIAVIVGRGHVERRFGVPVRAERRGAAPYAIVLAYEIPPGHELPPVGELFEEDPGDAICFTSTAPKRALSPKLGVVIDPEAGGDGLVVKEVASASLAELAGVKAGDRITGLSGLVVSDLEDLRIGLALQFERVGTIEVSRGDESRTLTFDLAWTGP